MCYGLKRKHFAWHDLSGYGSFSILLVIKALIEKLSDPISTKACKNTYVVHQIFESDSFGKTKAKAKVQINILNKNTDMR